MMWPVQVHDIVRTVDLDCDGYISWDEFKRAFHEPSKYRKPIN